MINAGKLVDFYPDSPSKFSSLRTVVARVFIRLLSGSDLFALKHRML